METKKFQIGGYEYEFLKYRNEWVIPFIGTYQNGLGSPIAVELFAYEDGDLEPYTTVTVNIPEAPRSAGCQFINTNNNSEDILDWLEEYGFGKRVESTTQSGFCRYPLFKFYGGERFHDYKKVSEKLFG